VVSGYSPETKDLLWPPAFEQVAAAEGWQLRGIHGDVEVDYDPIPDNMGGSPYRVLIAWIILNAYVLGSPAHLTAWEFEYAANKEIYDDGQVPGDSMYRVYNDATGEVSWVADDGHEWRR
jgi:hypothetical protein